MQSMIPKFVTKMFKPPVRNENIFVFEVRHVIST